MGINVAATETTKTEQKPKQPKKPQNDPSGVLSQSEVARLIVDDCKLAERLGPSVCLTCSNRVMAQHGQTVTLYCKALYRDLETCISRCTHFIQD